MTGYCLVLKKDCLFWNFLRTVCKPVNAVYTPRLSKVVILFFIICICNCHITRCRLTSGNRPTLPQRGVPTLSLILVYNRSSYFVFMLI